MKLKRKFFRTHEVIRGGYAEEDRIQCSEDVATLVSSEVDGTIGMHEPVIDIDYSARLVPSSTAGHFHLYLDRAIPWRKYKRVLRAMARAGLIETGYYRASKARGATFVRREGVTKENEAGVLAATGPAVPVVELPERYIIASAHIEREPVPHAIVELVSVGGDADRLIKRLFDEDVSNSVLRLVRETTD